MAHHPTEGIGKANQLLGGDRRQAGLAAAHCGLIITQLGYGGSSVLQKVAVTTGVNTFVFAVYRDLVALAVLIPAAYFFERKQRRPLTSKILGFIVASGLTGVFGGQCLQLIGLSLSTVSMAAVAPISTPVFTLIISLSVGVEKIHWKTRAGQAKALAILLSVSGGVILCTVKGVAILGPRIPDGLTEKIRGGEVSTDSVFFNLEPWQIGAICIILSALSYAIFIVLQAPALAVYPAPISLTAFSYLVGAIMLALTGVLTIKDSSSWVINQRSVFIPLVYSGMVSSAINFTIQSWAVQTAGPLLVAFYIPLQAVTATILAYLFLGETIFVGSLLGALLIGTGLYLITWAKAKTQHEGFLLEGDITRFLPENGATTTQDNLEDPLLR